MKFYNNLNYEYEIIVKPTKATMKSIIVKSIESKIQEFSGIQDNDSIYYNDDSWVGNSNTGSELYLYNENINFNVELMWEFSESKNDIYFTQIILFHPDIKEQMISSFGIPAIALIDSGDLIFDDILQIWLQEKTWRLKDITELPLKCEYYIVHPI